MEKQAIVELFMSLDDPVKTEKFWDIYENCEYKRKELGQKRLSLLIEYVTNFKTLTGIQTEDLIIKNDETEKK